MIRGEDPLKGVDFISNALRLLKAQQEGNFPQTFNEIFPPSKEELDLQPQK